MPYSESQENPADAIAAAVPRNLRYRPVDDQKLVDGLGTPEGSPRRWYCTRFRSAAEVDILEARWQIQRRQSPTLLLTRARQRLEKAMALEPNEASYPCALAGVHRFQAEWNIRQNALEDARRELSEGINMARQAVAIDVNLAEGAGTIGVLSLLQAQIEPDPVRRSELALAARQSIEKALALNKYLQREYAAPLTEARAFTSR
ncbi:MAG: hypothetical protein HYX75_20560 [Acidobacteria bacterium]|nr:hypothetical protein [Acidobacteriota bacterium]